MSQADAGSLPTARRRGRPVGSDSVETRNRILEAARRVVNERGFPAATFQAIALEADLSRPTLHYYFTSREEIYDVLAEEAGSVVADCIARAESRDTLVGSLSSLISTMWDLDYRDHSQIAFLISARLEYSRNPKLGYDRCAGLRSHLGALVEQAAARGELADATDVGPIADMLNAVLWGVGLYAGFIDRQLDMGLITKQLDQTLTHGLLSGSHRAARRADESGDTCHDTPSAVGGRP
ncbi:TetR/AcrR family transcriptional regulator [Mycolicibacterium sp. 624]|uniref:TetR/AcrR family transcriptional regulator n=1 Tax=Mycolicibacterium sp. 624 TaxID=3156314 RepID=UPI003399ACFF